MQYHTILILCVKSLSRVRPLYCSLPQGLQPTRLLCPWNSPGKNTGVGCHSLLQGIFLAKGSNPDLLHWRQMLYHLSYYTIFTYPIFTYCSISVSFKIAKCTSSNFFKTDLVILGPLNFVMNFRISLSTSIKKPTGFWWALYSSLCFLITLQNKYATLYLHHEISLE